MAKYEIARKSIESNGMVRPAPLMASQCARMEVFQSKKERDEPWNNLPQQK